MVKITINYHQDTTKFDNEKKIEVVVKLQQRISGKELTDHNVSVVSINAFSVIMTSFLLVTLVS